MPAYETKSDYVEVAARHLCDAQKLMALAPFCPSASACPGPVQAQHFVGAMYLAGYAVECTLKAYLLVQYGRGTFSEVQAILRKAGPALRGAHAHALTRLLDVSDLKPPGSIQTAFLNCAKWSTDWRYAPRVPGFGEVDAKELVENAQAVCRWVDSERAKNEAMP
jgi:HEPN domain-containing protein